MTTLAEYNNNPGNLRPPKGVTYEGQIGVDEHGFAVFEKPEYGRNALIRDIKSKFKQGLTNPNDLIDKYTPASKENPENSRDNYKIHIAHGLGLDSTKASFPENSEEKVADLIASFESGKRSPSTSTGKDISKFAAPESDPEFLGDVGALAGLSTAAAIKTGQAIKGIFGGNKKSEIQKVEPTIGGELPASGATNEPTLESDIASPEPKPAGGKGVYNYAKAFDADELEARNATGMKKSQIWADMEKANAAKAKIAQIAPEMKFNPNAVTQYGFYLPESGGGGPRGAPKAEPINIPEPVPVTPKSPLPVQPSIGEQLGQKILSALSYFSLPAKLAMTGYETGYGAQDVQNKMAKKDKSGALVSALEHGSLAASPWMSDAAALAAKHGAPRLAAGLSPLGLAIPAGWTLYDVYKNSYLPVSSAQAQANLAKQYPDNTGNPMAAP